MPSSQFDWYRVSLINEQKPDLQQFQKIIRSANISSTLQRVPTSYRQKLLTLFQVMSSKVKRETKSMKSVTESLAYKKNAVADRIEHMEKGLEESKHQLVRMKGAVTEKKKMVNKLKEKIVTLKKTKSQETYFCPFCSRNDFPSRELFSFHMFSQHQTYKTEDQAANIPNNSFSSSVNNELKNFIITLKDKEMEMMKMILSQKKQFQTQDLERIYQRQMNTMTMKNQSEPQYLSQQRYAMSQGLGQEFYEGDVAGGYEGEIKGDEGQIKGDSQFLFYQKSEQYKKAAQKEEYSLRRALEERKKQLNRHPYYDIFKDMEENKSFNVDAQRLEEEMSTRKRLHELNQQGNYQDYSQSRKDTGLKFISNFNLKSNEQIPHSQIKPPVQPLKMTSNNLQYQQFNPSITDRLKEEQKRNTPNNSIYSNFGAKNTTKKGINSEQGYVFNSGLLVDDNGGYSDWEDYFGEDASHKYKRSKAQKPIQMPKRPQFSTESHNDPTINFNISKQTNQNISANPFNFPTQNSRQEQSVIEDEQIKLNPGSYSFVSKSEYSKQHLSQLLSPSKLEISQNSSHMQNSSSNVKNKYSMYHNSVHQKSSEMYDLSDSFSRRDFQLSKDQSSINLSDLKLSKLEKKRAEEKQKEKEILVVNEEQEILSPSDEKQSGNKQQKGQAQERFMKKPLEFILVSEQKSLNIQSIKETKINLLHEFQRKIGVSSQPAPLIPSNYSFQKKKTFQFHDFYRQSPPQTINKKSLKSSPNNRSSQGFFVDNKEFSKKQNKSPNSNGFEQNNEQRALSPQQFFDNEAKKTSSYGTFNPNPSQSNNPQSFVSQSVESSLRSSNRPPKGDLREYEKSSFGQIQQKPSMNNSRKQEQVPGERSSSRQRKRLRKHDDLQGGDVGLLNEFFKKEFTPSDREQLSKSEKESETIRNQSQSKPSNRDYFLSSKINPSQSYSGKLSRANQLSQPQDEQNSERGVLYEFIK